MALVVVVMEFLVESMPPDLFIAMFLGGGWWCPSGFEGPFLQVCDPADCPGAMLLFYFM